MKIYIFTITYNFSNAYLSMKCDSREEAIAKLEEYLQTEIDVIRNECEYEPSVIRFGDDDVYLVYAEGYSIENSTELRSNEDTAYYRIFEVEV